MNSLSYHESHSHGSLGLPFQAYSQEDPYGKEEKVMAHI